MDGQTRTERIQVQTGFQLIIMRKERTIESSIYSHIAYHVNGPPPYLYIINYTYNVNSKREVLYVRFFKIVLKIKARGSGFARYKLSQESNKYKKLIFQLANRGRTLTETLCIQLSIKCCALFANSFINVTLLHNYASDTGLNPYSFTMYPWKLENKSQH